MITVFSLTEFNSHPSEVNYGILIDSGGVGLCSYKPINWTLRKQKFITHQFGSVWME